jgi:hypothetical protein
MNGPFHPISTPDITLCREESDTPKGGIQRRSYTKPISTPRRERQGEHEKTHEEKAEGRLIIGTPFEKASLIGYCECPETHTSPAGDDLFVADIPRH